MVERNRFPVGARGITSQPRAAQRPDLQDLRIAGARNVDVGLGFYRFVYSSLTHHSSTSARVDKRTAERTDEWESRRTTTDLTRGSPASRHAR